ncbi:MAG: glycosyltransferase family 4 protein [Flavobacteriales bacterium]|nr:glycosyltransferase family 4 protein [Flavobacteriales bacterium]MBP7155148.1 glycosyltransferase family 4 protein [Flavobacteriales bacterium]HQV74769.1 glycosyltransferase family 4 protein [Flavobacteriales bacterium]
MHVVLCTDGVFPLAMGGMQRHSRLLAEHLARRGGSMITVLHPHGKQVFDPALGINEVMVEPIDTGKFYLHELWKYSGRVAKELDRVSADVILSQGFCVWKDMDRFSDRLIVHPHGLEMFQGMTTKERIMGAPFRIALRYMVRRSRSVISLGGKLTPVLQRLAQGSKCTVVTVPNAVELPTVAPATARLHGPLRILFVGRFAFNKGLDVLMTVARRLELEGKTKEVLFQLAGDGPLMATYQAMGLPKNVELLGRVDDERLFKLYSECDALLLPTRFEGMPTVVLEAMARSRPIMVSDVGASAELVDGLNGYLLPKGNADALYTAVMEFNAMPDQQRAKMGAASLERVTKRFTWPAVTEEFIALFNRVAAGRGQRV